MSKSIYELFTSAAMVSYWNELNSNRIPYLGEVLFPIKKQRGLKLEWIKGFNSLPIALMPSAFDAKPSVRDRIGVSDFSTKMPFFRESMRIGEEDRQQLLMLLDANRPYVQDVINRLFDDAGTLISGALVQPERMIMQMIIDGKIDISAVNDSGSTVSYQYDFDPSGDWTSKNTSTLLTTSKWDAPTTADPVTDLIDTKRYMEATYGVAITRGIMSLATWLKLLKCESIKKDMNVSNGLNITLTDSMLKAYLLDKTGISFNIYTKQYKDESGTSKQFYPDAYVSLLPAYSLGYTNFGTTPEEADLMSGNTDATVTLVNQGIAVLTKKESLPVNIITSVSEIVLPSFERMSDVFTMKVY